MVPNLFDFSRRWRGMESAAALLALLAVPAAAQWKAPASPSNHVETPRRMHPSTPRAARSHVNAHLRASAVPSAPNPPAWLPLGPSGLIDPVAGAVAGRIAAVAIDTSHPGTVYLGGMGGVWKTTDNGLDWLPLTGALPVPAVGALALDPRQPGVVYAGTGDPNGAQGSDAGIGLLRSSDNGQTWSVLGAANFSGLAISRIAVDPADSTHLLVTAVTAANSPSGVQPGLYATVDGGSTWICVEPGEGWDFAWDASTGAVLAVVGSHLYRSADNGATFAPVTAAPVPTVITRAAICALAGQKAFLLVTADAQFNLGALLTTANDGQTWTSVTGPRDLFGPSGSGQGSYDIAAAADPANALHWWVAGVDVWETRDGGASWTNVTGGAQVHPDQHALSVANGSLWVGNDGGVWSQSPGGGFTNLNAGLANLGMLSVAASAASSKVWATSFQNGLDAMSSTASSGQVRISGGGGTVATSPSAASQQVYFAAPQLAALEASSDDGASFTPVSASGSTASPLGDTAKAPWLPPLAVDPNQPNTVYCGTWRVWKSTDGGLTWASLTGSETTGTIAALAISPVDSNSVWAATSAGGLLASADGGATWNALAETGLPALPMADLRAAADSTGHLWAALSGANSSGASPGNVFVSRDGGASWTDASGNLPNSPVHHLLLDPLDPGVVYAALDSGVFATGDGGIHWFRLGNGLPASPVMDLALDANRDLLAATFGRGLWKLPLPNASQNLTLVSGNDQTGPVQQPLAQPLTVAVSNVFGLPLTGATVQWSDGGAGGSFSSSSLVSDGQGQASATYALPAASGPVTIQATTGSSTVNFSETAAPLAPAALQSIGGDLQSGIVSTKLPQDLSVRVVDSLGNGVPNIAVSFSDGGAGGQWTAASVNTGSNGMAVDGYTLPPTAGPVTVTAASSGLVSVTFNLTASPAPDFKLQPPGPIPPVNQNATLTVQIGTQSIGGDTAPISFTCQQPTTGCSFSPSSVPPGQSTTLSLGTGSLTAGATSTVVVQGEDLVHPASTVSFPVTVIAMGLSFGAAPSPATVAAGTNATFPLSLTPAGGLTGPVQLSAAMPSGGDLPTGMGLSFNPSALNLTGAAAVPDVLTITTTSRVLSSVGPLPPALSLRPLSRHGWLWALPLLLLPGCLPIGGRRRRRKRMQSAALALLLVTAAACGGGGAAAYSPAPQPKINPNGTPAGAYTITVTANAGSVSTTTQVQVAVQ